MNSQILSDIELQSLDSSTRGWYYKLENNIIYLIIKGKYTILDIKNILKEVSEDEKASSYGY